MVDKITSLTYGELKSRMGNLLEWSQRVLRSRLSATSGKIGSEEFERHGELRNGIVVPQISPPLVPGGVKFFSSHPPKRSTLRESPNNGYTLTRRLDNAFERLPHSIGAYTCTFSTKESRVIEFPANPCTPRPTTPSARRSCTISEGSLGKTKGQHYPNEAYGLRTFGGWLV